MKPLHAYHFSMKSRLIMRCNFLLLTAIKLPLYRLTYLSKIRPVYLLLKLIVSYDIIVYRLNIIITRGTKSSFRVLWSVDSVSSNTEHSEKRKREIIVTLLISKGINSDYYSNKHNAELKQTDPGTKFTGEFSTKGHIFPPNTYLLFP